MLSLRSCLLNHLVDDSNVCEGSSSHDLIITSSSSIGVVVLNIDTLGLQVSGSRGVLSDLSSGGDVIGGDRVSQVQQHVSLIDIGDLRLLSVHGLEERWVVDVG